MHEKEEKKNQATRETEKTESEKISELQKTITDIESELNSRSTDEKRKALLNVRLRKAKKDLANMKRSQVTGRNDRVNVAPGKTWRTAENTKIDIR